jgi:7-cyano-7-deazaguanine synthase
MMSKALVILSGGQDSTTCLFWAKKHYDEVHAVTFDYGQRHIIEIEAAKKVAEMAGVASHEIIQVPNCLVSTSPLTSANELEQYENHDQMESVISDRVEKTFVPMRNTLFFTIAMNRAAALSCQFLVSGICGADNANYPDCTEEFRRDFNVLVNTSLGLSYSQDSNAFEIKAPLMWLSKSDSVALAMTLPGCMKALAYSHTGYDGKYPPTDMNHANVLRAKGFEDAGVPDPLVVRAWGAGLMPMPASKNYDDLWAHYCGTVANLNEERKLHREGC